jgi:hypothetical protein
MQFLYQKPAILAETAVFFTAPEANHKQYALRQNTYNSYHN